MPGLDPSIVKHFLQLDTERFPPKRQHLRRQRADLLLRIKEEVIKQVDAGFLESKEGGDHLVNLKRLFERLKKYKLRLNPAKCTFGVKSGKLLGFVVSEKCIEVDPNKVKAIMELPPPSTMHEYTLYHTIRLLSKTDPLKYLLDSPSSMRNIAKWHCQLTEYDIKYVSRTSVKGQAIADNLAEFPIDNDTPINSDFPDEGILQLNDEEESPRWKMYFDSAVNSTGSGGSRPQSQGARSVWRFYAHNLSDAQIVEHEGSQAAVVSLVSRGVRGELRELSFTYTLCMKNQFANALATLPSMVSITKENLIEPLEFEIARGPAHCDVIDVVDGKPWTLQRIAANFFLSGETLYHRSFDATLLWCVYENEVYANQIKAPPNDLHPMVAPWPFSMWGMDVIGPINPKASNGHLFIFVAIDYFTKWIEAITLTSVTAKAVARFLKRDIIACELQRLARDDPIRTLGLLDIHPIVYQGNPVFFGLRYGNSSSSRSGDSLHEQRMFRAFNKRVHPREFSPGDLVLRKVLHIAPDSRGKFAYKYDGPFIVKEVFDEGAIILNDMDGTKNALPLRKFAEPARSCFLQIRWAYSPVHPCFKLPTQVRRAYSLVLLANPLGLFANAHFLLSFASSPSLLARASCNSVGPARPGIFYIALSFKLRKFTKPARPCILSFKLYRSPSLLARAHFLLRFASSPCLLARASYNSARPAPPCIFYTALSFKLHKFTEPARSCFMQIRWACSPMLLTKTLGKRPLSFAPHFSLSTAHFIKHRTFH
ncbi:hypothetical protein CRG98_029690 [Punica granatum]|uniref:Integrase catalytic domain-containing protein n=1 Tax=Punica granatum TaxID=22663 RepID=A0A2I0J2I7_PUNGR|nr:hypothetical protein CRG98_029690 [Punica granatum]